MPDTPNLRLSSEDYRQTGAEIAITVDGEPVTAILGDTIAAAMAAAGRRSFGVDRGRERSAFCGMGICMDCIVTVDGRPGQRACLTKALAGQDVRTGAAVGNGQVAGTLREESRDVIIVGAGPAGLVAAEHLARHGLTVTVLDERPAPGGQYFKPLSPAFIPRSGEAADHQFAEGLARVRSAVAAGAEIRSGSMVWDIARESNGFHVYAESHGMPARWTARYIIVAAGAAERPLPVSGWTLPGVMTTGAAQTLSRSYRVAPGRRFLIAGNGPLNLQLASALTADGAAPVGVAEAAAAPWSSPGAAARVVLHGPAHARQGLQYLAQLWAARVPVHFSTVLLHIHGERRVEAATIAAIDGQGLPVAGSEQVLDVDTVCMGYGFRPNLDLQQVLGVPMAQDRRGHAAGAVPETDECGRTAIPGLYVAGDCAGIWGADLAQTSGALAAAALIEDSGNSSTTGAGYSGLLRRRRRQRAFQNALWSLYRAPPLDRFCGDDAILCRCESVPRSAVLRQPDTGAASLADIKRATRCGMGRCQGRLCSANLSTCRPSGMTEQAISAQIPAKPLTLAGLAGYAALIGDAGTVAPVPAIRLPQREPLSAPIMTDIAVIGGGGIGLCTALALNRAGADVVVIDRAQGRGQASFGNAGSLHTQLLCYAFSDLDGDNVRAALGLLRLQQHSVTMWRDLAGQFDVDIEMAVTGGLIVAETAEQMDKLRRVVTMQNAAGRDCSLLSGMEARKLVPHLSGSVQGASFAADEGKLNPLLAAPALARLARRRGVQLLEYAALEGIRRDASGYTINTSRGIVRANRIVNAAGGWAGDIAAMIGDNIPVRATPLHMLVTEAAPPLTDYLIAHVSERLTMKQARAGNMIIGGGWRAVAAADGRLRASSPRMAGNLAIAAQILPPIADLLILRSWVAVNSGTDGRPILAESSREKDFFHAVTMNGMTLAPAFGQACADLVLGHKTDFPEVGQA